MSFNDETQGKLDQVARKIQRINPSAANRLYRLGAAVVNAPNSMSGAWSATNIQQMIDARVIAEQMRAKDIPPISLRILEWFRNLLIFIPLVLTWYAISNAVSAYAVFINSIRNTHPEQMQIPFLYLWQQGFGGNLPDWLILSKVAIYDCFLLALLVLLTGVVNSRSHLRRSQKEQEAELLQEELTDALADAALCLAPNQIGQQPVNLSNIAQLLQQLLVEMAQERQRLDELSKRRENEMANLKAFTDALSPISQNMLNGASHIQQSSDKLTLTLQNLTAPVQQVANDQRQLVGTLGQLLQLQGDTSQNVRQLVTDQREWGKLLEEATDQLITSTRSLNQLPAAINQWTNQLGGLVNQLTIEHKAQAQVSQMTADASAGLQDALKNIHAASNELRSMANDFFTIMNLQKGFSDSVIRVAQGGDHLASAAKYLFDVANNLNGGNGNGHVNGQAYP